MTFVLHCTGNVNNLTKGEKMKNKKNNLKNKEKKIAKLYTQLVWAERSIRYDKQQTIAEIKSKIKSLKEGA